MKVKKDKTVRKERKDIKETRYTIRVGEEQETLINEYCERTGMTKSDLFRRAVMSILQRKGDA